jgi:hypothetical protein
MMMRVLIVDLLSERTIEDLGYVVNYPQENNIVWTDNGHRWKVQTVEYDYPAKLIKIIVYPYQS